MPVELKDYEEFVKAMKVMWFNPESNADLKERIIKKFIARIEIDVDSIAIDFWMGKGFFQRESRGLDLKASGQVPERLENLKIFGSSTCQSGGGDGYLVELRGTNDRTSISTHYSIDWKSRRPVPYYFMSIKGQGGTECKSSLQ